MKVSRRQRLFIDAYLTTWNASEAARQAGYTHPDRQGYRLLRYVEIQEIVQQKLSEKAMKADEVLARLAEQARNNIADFVSEKTITVYDKNGNPTEVVTTELDWDAIKARGHLIKAIKPTAAGTSIELYDGQAALVHIGKHLGMFKDVSIDIDFSALSDTQIERLAAGEDIYKVLGDRSAATASKSRARAAAAGEAAPSSEDLPE